MSEDKSENISEEEKVEPEESLQDVMASGGMFNSPLFWGLLIFIPIALTLFISVKNAPKEAPSVEISIGDASVKAVVKKAPARYRGEPSRGAP